MKISKVVGITLMVVGEVIQMKAVYELYQIATKSQEEADNWKAVADHWYKEWDYWYLRYFGIERT